MDIQKFNIIGISVRTTNENGQSGQDILALWNQFFSKGIPEKIANKSSNDIICVYTDYEKDHTKPYTTLLGFAVENLDSIPEGLTGKTIEGLHYEKFTAKGNLANGVVYDEWLKIWDSGLNRIFTSDFEVYGEKALDRENAEVDIFIAIQ